MTFVTNISYPMQVFEQSLFLFTLTLAAKKSGLCGVIFTKVDSVKSLEEVCFIS